MTQEGITTKREKFFESIEPLFKNSIRGEFKEDLKSAEEKDGVIAVAFELKGRFFSKKGNEAVSEVGTDFWKRVGNKWLFVKTVDKQFTVTQSHD